MDIKKIFIVFLTVLPFLLPVSSDACTTFCFQYKGDWIYGRNYDWSIEHGMIVVNKRGVAKVAFTESNQAQWISKYGSVTFNQYGRELPLGGMNEAGLVIECMWLQQTEYPHSDSRSEMIELQWIQYQLDNHATVDEVIASDKRVKISVRNPQPLHFLVCDRKGRSVAIEFLGGKMKAYTKDDLPATALTNNTYSYSLGLLKLSRGDENSAAFKDANYSVKRFVWAAKGVKSWDPKTSGSAVDYAFKILDKVAVDLTMFRIVYDVKNGRIYFRTKSNPEICFLEFKKFDFSCKSPVKIYDMSVKNKGNVTKLFSDYTYEANYNLILKSFKGTGFLKNTPEQILQMIARYPDSLQCK